MKPYLNLAMRLNDIAKASHEVARSKGFWDGDVADPVKKLLLIHSEVSEAAEELRKGRILNLYYDGESPKPEGLPSELADVLIRTLDLMHGLGIDAEKVVREKMEYNKTRPMLNGGGKKF